MRNILTKSIHKILIITVLFSVALSLGLENIKSDYNYLKSIDNDAYIYIELAENGLDAVSADHRSTRLLIPVSAFYLSKINFFKGKYNKPQTKPKFCNSKEKLVFHILCLKYKER